MNTVLSDAIAPVITLEIFSPNVTVTLASIACGALVIFGILATLEIFSSLRDNRRLNIAIWTFLAITVVGVLAVIPAGVIESRLVGSNKEALRSAISQYGKPSENSTLNPGASWFLETEKNKFITCETLTKPAGEKTMDYFVFCSDPVTDDRVPVQEVTNL